jgi:hypothetical protein
LSVNDESLLSSESYLNYNPDLFHFSSLVSNRLISYDNETKDSQYYSFTTTNNTNNGTLINYSNQEDQNIVSKKVKMILDSGSNIHLFNDSSLLSDIQTIPPVKIFGLNNHISCTKAGMLRPLGLVYFCPEASSNLVSLSRLINTSEVKIDKSTKTITIGKDDFLLKFKLDRQGLFICYAVFDRVTNAVSFHTTHSPNNANPSPCCFHLSKKQYETVNEESLVRISKQESEKIQFIAHLHEALAHPSDLALKLTIKNKCVNLPFEIEPSDVDRYRRLVGPCNYCLIGKNKFDQQPADDFRASKIGENVTSHNSPMSLQQLITQFGPLIDPVSSMIPFTSLSNTLLKLETPPATYSDILSIPSFFYLYSLHSDILFTCSFECQ